MAHPNSGVNNQSLPTALQSIAQLLKTEDDLDKIARLKEQIQKEKSQIEIELKNKVTVELDSLLSNFQSLQVSSQDLKKLRRFVIEVNTVAEKSFNSIQNFGSINKLTKIHEVLESVAHIVDRISNFEPELRELEELIEEENYEDVAPDSVVPNLLLIHYKLNSLLNFKDLVVELSRFSNEDSKFVIKKLVKKIDPVVQKFEILMRNVIEDLIEKCECQNHSLIVRLFKVLNFEDLQDLRVSTQRQAFLKTTSDGNSSNEEKLIFEQIINGNLNNQRIFERGYRDFFIKTVEADVREVFNRCWETFHSKGGTAELFSIFDHLDWVFGDLQTVQTQLVHLVPDDPNRWDIFKLYFDFYHKGLQGIMVKLIETEPETYFILQILDFDERFAKVMKNDFGISDVETVIGHEAKEQLLTDYLKLSTTMIREWMSNLKVTEQRTFQTRLVAPQIDPEGLYGLEGSKSVFQMFTQQCQVSIDTKQDVIIEGVINEFINALLARQNDWGKLIHSEVEKLIAQNERERSKKKPEEEEEQVEAVPPGLLEYLVALGNDQMRGADYTEAISNKYSSAVSRSYQSEIGNTLERAIDGFADLGKRCCDAMIVIMFQDFTILTTVLDKSWLKDETENVIRVVCDTIYEYLGEYKEHMNEYLFETLCEELMEECILRYFANLNKEPGIFKEKRRDNVISLVQRDRAVFVETFQTFYAATGEIEARFNIMEEFADMIALDGEETEIEDDIIAIWETIVREYNEIPLRFFELVLKFKQVSKSQTKRLISRAEASQIHILRVELGLDQLVPSFMGRFK